MDNIKVGLEVHVQLNTNTKLFCSCSTKNMLNAKPNSRTCAICLGHPGARPTLNRAVIESALKISLALGCKIAKDSFFSRKTYFYPDMSKNFQITQYEIPFASNGKLEIVNEKGKRKTIRIRRVDIEEDPAKLQHIGGNITDSDYTLIDYNRSGIPLCEIVTEPDLSSPKEARTFLKKLEAILDYLNVILSNSGLKVDTNISIDNGKRVEIKNITGYNDVKEAIVKETFRQDWLKRNGGKVVQETRAWIANRKDTISLRKKETEEDYGYIFEPDLTKIVVDDVLISKIRKKIPELPHQKFERYQKQFGITSELSSSISGDLRLAKFYENVVKKVDPKISATWIDILKKTLLYNNVSIEETKITENLFIKLIKLVQKEKITDLAGEMILREIIFKPSKFISLVKRFSKVNDIENIVEGVLRDEKKAVNDYKSGNKKAIQYVIGQVIKKSGKRIDAKTAYKIIEKRINGSG